jgi:hypothetical protein
MITGGGGGGGDGDDFDDDDGAGDGTRSRISLKFWALSVVGYSEQGKTFRRPEPFTSSGEKAGKQLLSLDPLHIIVDLKSLEAACPVRDAKRRALRVIIITKSNIPL